MGHSTEVTSQEARGCTDTHSKGGHLSAFLSPHLASLQHEGKEKQCGEVKDDDRALRARAAPRKEEVEARV